jgi:hypothetical protein
MNPDLDLVSAAPAVPFSPSADGLQARFDLVVAG